MSWSLFGALSAVIGKRTMPEPIKKLLYETEDEIDNLVQSESDMEVIAKSVNAFKNYIIPKTEDDAEDDFRRSVFNDVINSEQAINGILNAQGDKEYFINWVYNFDYSKEQWRENPIPIGKYLIYLVEMDWTQFTDIDEVVDDESAMDKVTDKEMPMDKVTDSEIAMDKVMADVMLRTKILLSPHIVDTMWSKEMASKKFWNNGFDHDENNITLPYTRNGKSSAVGDYEVKADGAKKTPSGGKALIVEYLDSDQHDNEKAWGIDLDLSNVSEISLYLDSSDGYHMHVWVNNNKELEAVEPSSWENFTIDVSGYSGINTLWLGFRSGWSGDMHYFGDIKLS